MAISDIVELASQTGNFSGESGHYDDNGVSNTTGLYQPINYDSNYSDNSNQDFTYPLGAYNPYANGVPQSIIDAQNEINDKSIPNQDYAQQVQDTIIRDNLGYKTDPNYKGTYSAEEAAEAFEYLSRANNGANYTNWVAPKADDQLFTEIAPRWDAARNIQNAAIEQYNAPTPTVENSVLQNGQWNKAQQEILQANQIQKGDWNLLPWTDKLKALFIPASNLQDTMENAPWWSKYIQNIFPSVMAGGGGAALGSVAGPVGSVVGGVTIGGLSYLQGVTGVEIPVINELLTGMDILSIWAEQAQGAIGSAMKETWDKAMSDGSTDLLELGKTMGEVLQDFPDLWEVGQLSYEVGADLGFDNFFNLIRNAGAGASDALFGTNFGQVDTNAVSRANMGISGLIDVNPDTRGYDSLTKTYLPLYKGLRDEFVNQGISYDDAKQAAIDSLSQLLAPYMGTTGLANDFAASSLFDPMNLAPYVSAKIAEGVGKKTGDTSLLKAAKAAQEGASPIVDALSVPLIQPIVEFITGKHATQGLDTILKTAAQDYQTKPVDSLNSLQKRIAGIDNNGLIKNFNAEKNPLKRFLGQTEEAKLYQMADLTTSLFGSLIFDSRPEAIPELVSQFVGISPITDDSPLVNYRNSAILNTIQSTLGNINIEDIQKIQKRIDGYRRLNENRMAVDTVANALHMKPDEIFDALDDPQRAAQLKKRIQDNKITMTDSTGFVLSPNMVYDKMNVFSSNDIGRKQYTLDNIKIDLMETVTNQVEHNLLERYNIKPDAWFNRLGELTKSVQSIALLNFSPSYFVNNWLNNLVTRSVVGVGGFDTNDTKNKTNKRGLFFSRDEKPYKDAKAKIIEKKTAKDFIGKLNEVWGKVTDTEKPIGKILKGFNNIDIEGLEKRSAFEIGANRYWDATWQPGLNIPELPKELQAIGFTPEMNVQIYNIAMDSNNVNEFKSKLIGDVVLPGANTTLSDMLSKNYSESTGKLIRNMIESMPRLKEAVADLLDTGNPDVIRNGFQKLINELSRDIDLKNIAQLNTEFENLANRFAVEGLSAVASARLALDDLFADIWIEQTKESEELFARRISDGLLSEQNFRPLYEEHIRRENADFNIARKYEVQYLAATIVGLGLEEDISKQLMQNKLQYFDNQMKYIDEEHKLFMKYGDPTSESYDYDYYIKSKIEMLQRVQEMQLDAQKQNDAFMVQYLRDNLDKKYTSMIDDYEQRLGEIQRKRSDLNKKEIEWLTDRSNERDLKAKHEISTHQNTQRRIAKDDIYTWQSDANKLLQNLTGGFEKEKSKNKIHLTVEQTLWLELLYREAKIDVDNSGNFLEHFLDKSDPQTVFTPADFSNTNVNESFVDYNKKNVDAATLAEMQKRYKNGDAVPLGSVDLRDSQNMTGIIDIPIDNDTVQPVDTQPVDTQSQPEQTVPQPDVSTNPENQPIQQDVNFEENPLITDFPDFDESDIPDIPDNMEPVDTENVRDIKEIIDELNESIDLENLSDKEKTIVKDANNYRTVIDEKSGDYVDNYQYYDEARRSILSDIKDKKSIKEIVINAEKQVIETARRKMYGMLDQELKKSKDKVFGLTKEELKDVIDYTIDSITVSIDYDLFNTKREFNYDTDVLDSIKNMTDSGRKYLKSISNKANKQIEKLQYYYNNFYEKLSNEKADVISPEITNKNIAVPETKVEPVKYAGKDKYDNLSEAQKELDITNKKFDSYEEYEKWLKDKGIKLKDDEDFIPEKYQSKKYNSDLKDQIIKANDERNKLVTELEKNNKKIKWIAEHDPFAKDYKSYKDLVKSSERLDLVIRVNDKKNLKLLSKDEYYRDWLNSERGFKTENGFTDVKVTDANGNVSTKKLPKRSINYEGLVNSLKDNLKFEPELRPDSKPAEIPNPAPKKPDINVNVDSPKVIREKMDQLYNERNIISSYKNKLIREERYIKDGNELHKKEAEIAHVTENQQRIDAQINKLQSQLWELERNKNSEQSVEKIPANNIDNTTNQPEVANSEFANPEVVNPETISNNNAPEEIPVIPSEAQMNEEINNLVEEIPQNKFTEDFETGYQPIKSDFDKSEAKFSQVASKPFYYGDHLVKAGAYYKGDLIAYITSDMPETIKVSKYTFPVIGYDTADPNSVWVYVKDEPVKVTPGSPNNIEYTIYANGEHPMQYGSTPSTQPWGQAALETSLPLREALMLWRDQSIESLHNATKNGSFFGKLNQQQQDALNKWIDSKLVPAFNYQRFSSQRYGNKMVDLAMLNYDDRHGFDNLLTTIMPYQYWITRSVLNWGARMIDQPKWFSMYSRLEKLIEKNKQEYLPTRLEGMVGIPMPYLPKGLGQRLYFNPFDIALPQKQFYNMSEYFDRNLHTIHKNTISKIEEYYREGTPYNGKKITDKDYEDAMLGKGELYNKVFWDMKNSDETNTGLSGLVGSLFNPNVLASSVFKAIEANGKLHGKDISYSPMFKLGNTLRSSAKNTAAEGLFGLLADGLQVPDTVWRKVLNVETDNIGSSWSNYWTVKYLTDMLYTKENSYNDVVNAIAEGESNPLWQEARGRYSTSEAYKQQGGALLNDVMQSIAGNKETSLGNLAGSALASIFGGRTYTGGEEDYRRMQDLYRKVKDNPEMYQEFWNQLPEYKVGGYASIDDPMELLHKILVDNCNNAYHALPDAQKKNVASALGPQFEELFLNPDTRATDQIDDKLLIEWTRAMEGNVPNISNKTINMPLENAMKVQWYSDSASGAYDKFQRDKKTLFPGIDTIEQGFFKTPETLQNMYLLTHPELQRYWNWKESAGMANPQLGSMLNMMTTQNQTRNGKYQDIVQAVKSRVNNYTKTCLKNHIEKGWSLPASAEHQLKIAYTNLGINMPFETWLKEIRW